MQIPGPAQTCHLWGLQKVQDLGLWLLGQMHCTWLLLHPGGRVPQGQRPVWGEPGRAWAGRPELGQGQGWLVPSIYHRESFLRLQQGHLALSVPQ